MLFPPSTTILRKAHEHQQLTSLPETSLQEKSGCESLASQKMLPAFPFPPINCSFYQANEDSAIWVKSEEPGGHDLLFQWVKNYGMQVQGMNSYIIEQVQMHWPFFFLSLSPIKPSSSIQRTGSVLKSDWGNPAPSFFDSAELLPGGIERHLPAPKTVF